MGGGVGFRLIRVEIQPPPPDDVHSDVSSIGGNVEGMLECTTDKLQKVYDEQKWGS